VNTSFNQGTDMEVPKRIAPFVAQSPRLLPGETEQKYHELFDLLMDEIRPDAPTEWLAFASIVALCWDVGRYQAWKGAILNIYRRSALETAFKETHRSHAIVGDVPALFGMARKDAEDGRTDPAKRQILDTRLAEHGYDEEALNAGAFLEALEPLANIERALSSARRQLNSMLKEFYVRREFAARARKAFDEQFQAVVQTSTPKQIAPN